MSTLSGALRQDQSIWRSQIPEWMLFISLGFVALQITTFYAGDDTSDETIVLLNK